MSRLVTDAIIGSRPMNSGIRPNLIKSSRHDLGETIDRIQFGLRPNLGAETDTALADTIGDDPLETSESARDE